ncbi:hypothetical protein HDU87_002169 [Geranomyces variabilis]|uniref:Uncharacterized protein n=1 Tax=Geranomyces variabilis TaxID=109894 RepID=A0AAD5XNH5_9FUNG|nr:hypothetical protein HDU87_002169 [Geranomyces variabilis]
MAEAVQLDLTAVVQAHAALLADAQNEDARARFLKDVKTLVESTTDDTEYQTYAALNELLQASEALHELGWELAQLIGPKVGLRSTWVKGEKCGPELLLSTIAVAVNPRELALFSVELATTLVPDSESEETDDEDESDSGRGAAGGSESQPGTTSDFWYKATVFTAFLTMWATAMKRIKVSRVDLYIDTAAPALRRGVAILMNLCAHENDGTRDSLPSSHWQSLHDRLLALYVVILETLETHMFAQKVDQATSGFADLIFLVIGHGFGPVSCDLLAPEPYLALKDRMLAVAAKAGFGAKALLRAKEDTLGRSVLLAWLSDELPSLNDGDLVARLAACAPHVTRLLHGPPSAAYAQQALRLLSAAVKPIPPASINAGDTRRTDHVLDDLVQSTVLYLAHSTAQPAAGAFSIFRDLVARFDDTERARLLGLLMLDPLAPPTVRTAALAILKDNVHSCWDQPSPFSAQHIALTFLPALLNPTSPVYATDPSGAPANLLVGTAILDCVPIVMHALNLYLYILVRDKPASNVTRLWHPDHVAQTNDRFLHPMRERVTELLAKSDGRSENHLAANEAEEEAERTLALQMLRLVLDQIADRHSLGVTSTI